MDVSFDPEVANRYGVEDAILLRFIEQGLRKHEVHDEHFVDGHHWIRISSSGLAQIFPFWSARKITRSITRLVEAGVLLSRVDKSYDRTRWLTMAETLNDQYCPMEEPNLSHGTTNIGLSCARSNTSLFKRKLKEPLIEVSTSPIEPSTDSSSPGRNTINYSSIFEEFWQTYPRRVGKGAAWKQWKAAVKSLDKDGPRTLIESARLYAIARRKDDRQFIPHPATWLSQRRWEDDADIHAIQPSLNGLVR